MPASECVIPEAPQGPIDKSLLLHAFAPPEPRLGTELKSGACYRQWRLVRGESDTQHPENALGSASDAPPKGVGDEPFSSVGLSGLTLQSFSILQILGEGNYSQVYAATLDSTQRHIALKIIDKQKVSRYKKAGEVQVEKWVLSHLRHPSIVELYHTFQDHSALYLALELLPCGELWAQTHKSGLPLPLARFYSAQMLEALQFLHEHEVVHRDVKPENVLLTGDMHIKVIDFGTAKLLAQPKAHDMKEDPRRGSYKEFVGTPEYMAPEAIGNKYADTRADLWSFGCFVAQLVCGWPPFKGGSDYLTFLRVQARKYRLVEGTPKEVVDLCDLLLHLTPGKRLGSTTEGPHRGAPPLKEGGTPKTTEAERAAHAAAAAAPDAPEAAALVDHDKIRSHAFFAEGGCAERELWRAPVPEPSDTDMAMKALCERAAEQGAMAALGDNAAKTVSQWEPAMRSSVIFEFGKRQLLDESMRKLLGVGPPPPEISDDIEELQGMVGDMGDGDDEDDDDEEEVSYEAPEKKEAEHGRNTARRTRRMEAEEADGLVV